MCKKQTFQRSTLPQGELEMPIVLRVFQGTANSRAFSKMKQFLNDLYVESNRI